MWPFWRPMRPSRVIWGRLGGSGSACRTGRRRCWSTGARRAAPSLLATVEAELARLGLPAGAVALMGFSQGAMMVLHAGLRRAVPPAAILAYSGALLDSPALDAEMTGRPPVLLVHGEADDVVPFARGPAAEEALRRRGVPVTTSWRKGVGHWVDEGGLQVGAAMLRELPPLA